MNEMKKIVLLKAVIKEVKENFQLEADAIKAFSVNPKKITLKINDHDREISIAYDTSDALRIIFNDRKEQGEFKDCTFDEVEKLHKEGYELNEIEGELKERKLPFDGEAQPGEGEGEADASESN